MISFFSAIFQIEMLFCWRRECSVPCSSFSNRSRHERTCKRGELDLDEIIPLRSFMCPKRCGKILSRLFSLKRHVAKCQVNLIECPNCGSVTREKEKVLGGDSPQDEVNNSNASLDSIGDALPSVALTICKNC